MSSLGLEFSRWEGFLLNSASFGLIWPHCWNNALWIFCRMPCTTRFPHSSWRKHKLIPALCDLHKLLPLLWEVPVLVSGHFLIQCANQYLPDDSRGTLGWTLWFSVPLSSLWCTSQWTWATVTFSNSELHLLHLGRLPGPAWIPPSSSVA